MRVILPSSLRDNLTNIEILYIASIDKPQVAQLNRIPSKLLFSWVSCGFITIFIDIFHHREIPRLNIARLGFILPH